MCVCAMGESVYVYVCVWRVIESETTKRISLPGIVTSLMVCEEKVYASTIEPSP